jgi:hypothetical protein
MSTTEQEPVKAEVVDTTTSPLPAVRDEVDVALPEQDAQALAALDAFSSDDPWAKVDSGDLSPEPARISHLAYAPEIAAAMLRRQQASAIVAALFKIVEGAVGMVQHARKMLADERVVQLDEKAKAEMVANLMVVLCAEHSVQPVVNTGASTHGH